MKDSFDYQILNLTKDFYLSYPSPPYTELISKEQRPYNCLLIQSHYDYFICIPYRSSISHKYAFKFHNSARSKRTRSGLDYTKIIIVKNTRFLSDEDAIIDSDEYAETREHIETIKNEAIAYVDGYIDYINGTNTTCSKQELSRKYGFSSLKYFHNELGIVI